MMELQEGVNKQDVSSRAERSTFHSCSISKSLMYGKAPKEYLSLWSVIALGIGSMVGAGIFALMGQATLMAGKNVYWSFILGGVAALLSGYTYAKLGSRYPGSGGIMDYFNEAFSHKTLSGALTLIYLGTLVITVALVAKSFGAYAARLFLPDRAVTIYSTALFASVAILLLGALNMGGARAVGKSEVIMVAFKLLILTVLMLASFGSSVPVGADPVLAKRLQEAGAAAVMPLGAPIGTNKGVLTRELINIIIEQAIVPVVVDAGLGAPSHAAEALEMGADAVLVNTAIAASGSPSAMAEAFALACRAGRMAYLSGLPAVSSQATATSPLTSFLH